MGELAQFKPESLDYYDEGKAITEYAEAVGVHPEVVRTKEEVEGIRAQRQAAQQAAERAELAKQSAGVAQSLSNTPLDGNTALSALRESLVGAPMPGGAG